MSNGKQYKVLVPIEGKDGKKYWMKLGRGVTNKDSSINCYVDAIPVQVFAGKELTLQIREFDEEDLRRRDEYRSKTAGAGDSSYGGQPKLDGLPF